MSVAPIYVTRNNGQFILFSGEAMNKATVISSPVFEEFPVTQMGRYFTRNSLTW